MTLQGKPPLAPGGTEVRADLGRASCWARGGGGGGGPPVSWGRRARGAEARVGTPAFCQRGADVTEGACAQKTAGRVFHRHPWLTARGLRDYRARP